MNTKERLVFLIAALACLCAPGRAEPPRGRPATRPADRIRPFLEAIRTSEDYRTVMRAYARATGIDRNNVQLHRAYVRRMLAMGLPQIAYYAAQKLIAIDAADGMAWGLAGYMQARKGQLVDAFTSTIRAIEKIPEDPSVQHNAGQLVGWYDVDPSLPRVPDSARRTLAQMRTRLTQHPIFARAYKTIVQAYTKQKTGAAGLAAQLAAAEAQADAARQMARDIDRRLRDLNDEIEYRNRLIDQLWRELRHYYGGGTYRDGDGTVIVTTPGRYYRREMLERIRQEEQAVEALRLKLRQARREGEGVLGEMARKQAELQRLRDRFRREAARIEREFRWDPPAVDGKVVAEREGLPPTTRPSSVKLPVDPESAAAHRLDLARMYLRHDMSEKAIDMLGAIVKQYGATAAGKQARLLLSALRPAE